MLVFIDDSGDPGFKKIGSGASKFFVIVCLIFDDDLEAEKMAVAIKDYRRSKRFSDNMEFKFNKSSAEIKVEFLNTILPFKFRIRAIVVDKSKVKSVELKSKKDSFYNYFIKQVLTHHKGTLKDANIKIDGHGDREFRKNITSYLRRELNGNEAKVMSKLRLVDSKKNVLIQAAGMLAGSLRRTYEQKYDSDVQYKKLIQNRIEDCWEFE